MFSAFQVDATSLVARFNEGLRLMKALWTEPRVDFDGRFWQLKDAGTEPKPFQEPHPPIWFGASHPDALRRAARHGHGFFGAGSARGGRGRGGADPTRIKSSTKPSRWSAWWPRSCPTSRDALPPDQRFSPLASGDEAYGGRV
jgi:alkanesulfonate monooxygenase SsuD/methylene tetrahydromethanopterin reductase-like flavin-dependent oxidoreductase (luciferase family)